MATDVDGSPGRGGHARPAAGGASDWPLSRGEAVSRVFSLFAAEIDSYRRSPAGLEPRHEAEPGGDGAAVGTQTLVTAANIVFIGDRSSPPTEPSARERHVEDFAAQAAEAARTLARRLGRAPAPRGRGSRLLSVEVLPPWRPHESAGPRAHGGVGAGHLREHGQAAAVACLPEAVSCLMEAEDSFDSFLLRLSCISCADAQTDAVLQRELKAAFDWTNSGCAVTERELIARRAQLEATLGPGIVAAAARIEAEGSRALDRHQRLHIAEISTERSDRAAGCVIDNEDNADHSGFELADVADGVDHAGNLAAVLDIGTESSACEEAVPTARSIGLSDPELAAATPGEGDGEALGDEPQHDERYGHAAVSACARAETSGSNGAYAYTALSACEKADAPFPLGADREQGPGPNGAPTRMPSGALADKHLDGDTAVSACEEADAPGSLAEKVERGKGPKGVPTRMPPWASAGELLEGRTAFSACGEADTPGSRGAKVEQGLGPNGAPTRVPQGHGLARGGLTAFSACDEAEAPGSRGAKVEQGFGPNGLPTRVPHEALAGAQPVGNTAISACEEAEAPGSFGTKVGQGARPNGMPTSRPHAALAGGQPEGDTAVSACEKADAPLEAIAGEQLEARAAISACGQAGASSASGSPGLTRGRAARSAGDEAGPPTPAEEGDGDPWPTGSADEEALQASPEASCDCDAQLPEPEQEAGCSADEDQEFVNRNQRVHDDSGGARNGLLFSSEDEAAGGEAADPAAARRAGRRRKKAALKRQRRERLSRAATETDLESQEDALAVDGPGRLLTLQRLAVQCGIDPERCVELAQMAAVASVSPRVRLAVAQFAFHVERVSQPSGPAVGFVQIQEQRRRARNQKDLAWEVLAELTEAVIEDTPRRPLVLSLGAICKRLKVTEGAILSFLRALEVDLPRPLRSKSDLVAVLSSAAGSTRGDGWDPPATAEAATVRRPGKGGR